jgi:NADPH-dependent 2,4-dienoyl-CoA reductase/sulfur reductase-like enzyme
MKLVIIGGVAAGMSAAAKYRRLDPSATIHVYEQGTDLSYSGCGMPYHLGGIVPDEDRLIARTADDFSKQGIDVFLRHRVTAVDPASHHITVQNLTTNESFVTSYDKLLIATGTVARRTNVPGSDDVHPHVLNQLDDMRHIKSHLADASTIAIIGGGYIGVEVAENLRHLGKEVHLIEQQDQLLMPYDKALAVMAKDALERIGVHVYLSEALKQYGKTTSNIIVHTDQRDLTVDLVIEAIGVIPATSFLQDSGIDLAKNGAIRTDAQMRTNQPDIYAAGDCVLYHHRLTNQEVFIPLGTHANKTGRIVAEHIAGQDVSFPGIVGSNIVKVADLALAKTGLALKEANQLDREIDHVGITAKHTTGYYPGAKPLFVRLVFDKKTGVLLGGQLAGEAGVADRINILALAVTKGLTASEFSQLDFAYAPPFTPVWDPLLVAANQIKLD